MTWPLGALKKIRDCSTIPQLRYVFNCNKWIACVDEARSLIFIIIERIEYPSEYKEDLLLDMEIYDDLNHNRVNNIINFCLICGRPLKYNQDKFCSRECFYESKRGLLNEMHNL